MFQKGLTHARTHALTRTRTWVPTWRRQKSIRVATSSTTSCAFSIVRKLTYRYKRDLLDRFTQYRVSTPTLLRKTSYEISFTRTVASVCVYVGERMRVSGCAWERESVCVCVCVLERERERRINCCMREFVLRGARGREERERLFV